MSGFTHRGCAIEVVERGPADAEVVVLHHGLLMSAAGWERAGLLDALAETRRVWAIDSFGHGRSADPTDEELNGRDARADLVAALADEGGVDRFHLVGYSMGGWVAGAVARRHGDRLLSVSIGGWDVVDGMSTATRWTEETFGVPASFDLLLAAAGTALPEVNEATPERVEAWRRTYDRMDPHHPDDLDALSSLGAPLHLWCGRDDPYHAPLERAATSSGARFDSVPGDHITAFYSEEARAALVAFIGGA